MILVQPGHGLGDLVVIHQHHPLAPGLEQVDAAEHAHHAVVVVHHGEGPVLVVLGHLAHVVHVV